MDQQARVTSVAAIQDFRAHLIEFAETARRALAEAEYDVQRTLDWLQRDQLTHWKSEVIRLDRAVQQAKSDLYRKQLESPDTKTSAIEERKRLFKVEQALEHARQMVDKTMHWARVVEKEYALYLGVCSQVESTVAGEMPKAVAVLERVVDNLEKYLSTDSGTVQQFFDDDRSADDEDENEES